MPDIGNQKKNIFYRLRKYIASILLLGLILISGGVYPLRAKAITSIPVQGDLNPLSVPVKIKGKVDASTEADKANKSGEPTPTANFWQDIVIGPLKAFSSALQNFDYGDVLQLVLRNTLNKIIDKFYKNVAETFEKEYRVTDPFTQLWPYYTQLGFVKLHNKVREAVGGKMAAPLLDVYLTLEQLASNYVMNVGTGLTVEIFKKLNWVVEQTGEVTPDTLHKKQRAGDPDYYNLGMRSVGNDMMSTTFKVLGGILDQQAKSEAAANMDYTSSEGLNKASATTGLPEEGLRPIQTYWIDPATGLNVIDGVLEAKKKLDEFGYTEVNLTGGLTKKGEYQVEMGGQGGILRIWPWEDGYPIRIFFDLNYDITQIEVFNPITSNTVAIINSPISFTSRPSYDPLASGWTGLVKRPAQMVKQYLQDVVNTRFKVANEAESLTGMSKIMYEMMDKFTDAINFKIMRATSGPLKGCPVGFTSEVERLDKDMRQLDEPRNPSEWSCFLKAIGQIGWDTLPKFMNFVSGLAGKLICWVFDVGDYLPDAANKQKYYDRVPVTDTSTAQVDPEATRLRFKTDSVTGEETNEPQESSEYSHNTTESFLRHTSRFLIFKKLIKPHLKGWMLEWMLPSGLIDKFLGLFGVDIYLDWINNHTGGLIDLLYDFLDSTVFFEVIGWVLGQLGFCGPAADDGREPYQNPMGEADFLELPVELEKDGHIKVEIYDFTNRLDRSFDMGDLKKGVHILRINMKSAMQSGSAGLFAAGDYWAKIKAGDKVIKEYKKIHWVGHCERNPQIGDFTTADLDRTDAVQDFGLQMNKYDIAPGEEAEITMRWANRGKFWADDVQVRLYHINGVKGSTKDFYQGYGFYDDPHILQNADLLYDSKKNMSGWDGTDPANPYSCDFGCGQVDRINWSSGMAGAHAFIMLFSKEGGVDDNCKGNNRVVQVVNVGSGPLSLASWKFDDDVADSTNDGDRSGGDGTGRVNPGEGIEMILEIKNTSNEDIKGAEALLSIPSQDPYFLQQPNGLNATFVKLPDIPVNSTIRITQADLNFYVKPEASNNDFSTIDFLIRDVSGQMIYFKKIPVPIKTQCRDTVDNDGDGLIDFHNYTNPLESDPGCANWDDNSESGGGAQPQCSDGLDNDGDGKIDLNDPGCNDAQDDDETDVSITTPLSFTRCEIYDDSCEGGPCTDNDKKAQPGERIKLNVYLKNDRGTEKVYTQAVLSSSDSGINVTRTNRSYSLDPGEEDYNRHNFEIANNYSKPTIAFNIQGDDTNTGTPAVNANFAFNLNSLNPCSSSSCRPDGASCGQNSECCSNNCSGGVCGGSGGDKPDLAISSRYNFDQEWSISQDSFPLNQLNQGDIILVGFEIENTSQIDMAESDRFKMELWYRYGDTGEFRNSNLTQDSDGDSLVGISGLRAGGRKKFNFFWEIRENSNLYFALKIDAQNTIQESNENNNEPGLTAPFFMVPVEGGGGQESYDAAVSDVSLERIILSNRSIKGLAILRNNSSVEVKARDFEYEWKVLVLQDNPGTRLSSGCYQGTYPVFSAMTASLLQNIGAGENANLEINGDNLPLEAGKSYQIWVKVNIKDKTDQNPGNNEKCSNASSLAGAQISSLQTKPEAPKITATTQTYYQPLTLQQRVKRVWEYLMGSLSH